jgi:hypothetical protein
MTLTPVGAELRQRHRIGFWNEPGGASVVVLRSAMQKGGA